MPLESFLALLHKLRERIDAHGDKLRQSEALTRYALIDPLPAPFIPVVEGTKNVSPTRGGVLILSLRISSILSLRSGRYTSRHMARSDRSSRPLNSSSST